ncbi:electron transfer flavoprotein subunit alpha/FixB family protein [bacterium]|nr:MAG: electron transfer flavoprotein subunit alpha/FixB family protein [bacterium]
MSRLLGVAFEAADLPAMHAFAAQLGLPYDVLLLSGGSETAGGAEKVFTAGLSEIPPADGLAPAIVAIAGGYSHLAAGSSMRSKDLMARIAGSLRAAAVTDVLALESPTRFKRPMLAGSVEAFVDTLVEPVVLTFRPAGFRGAVGLGGGSVEAISLEIATRSRRISSQSRGGARPDLGQARIVISGGRPLKDAETFERVLGGFADALGGAVGATRAAVDAGIAPNELQVGQTGKIVAPDLYIAAGVSGSTQHMAGIKDSRLIVAINKDSGAPIFESADLGLVGDLYEVLPELQAKLKR